MYCFLLCIYTNSAAFQFDKICMTDIMKLSLGKENTRWAF